MNDTVTFSLTPGGVVTEATLREIYQLGRAFALEEAAQIADELAEGVANPEKPYNEAFIHACGVVARAIREAK